MPSKYCSYERTICEKQKNNNCITCKFFNTKIMRHPILLKKNIIFIQNQNNSNIMDFNYKWINIV